ncbi:MAG: MiaB/RimO family radical SAM methylthiotransferase, partial [Proteobacteria bacterium]|nr:MiaB/RimO family radical SAM methylthiotransferase [Pseudomonadota bacterium]
CTFCIIPKLRGGMRSRTLESVVEEVKVLGANGIREVNLVAQDLTSYGSDRKAAGLSQLLRALDATGAVDWIRLLYAYPIGIEEELLSTIVESARVVEYLDLPLQHSSESVLKPMQRPLGRYSPRRIVDFIRKAQPSIHLRTTFIVGFPGETEEDVDDLEAFVREGHFTNVGVFTYSPEEGTPSYEMPGQIPDKVKNDRRRRVMLAQQEVNAHRLNALIGTRIEAMVEGSHEDTDLLLSARARFQAPDVDGTVIINDMGDGIQPPTPGQRCLVEITEVAGYDLIGTMVEGV